MQKAKQNSTAAFIRETLGSCVRVQKSTKSIPKYIFRIHNVINHKNDNTIKAKIIINIGCIRYNCIAIIASIRVDSRAKWSIFASERYEWTVSITAD